MFGAVRCAHVSKPLARSVGDVTTIATHAFEHSGALFFDGIGGLQLSMRIIAKHVEHWRSPFLEFLTCDSGGHFALKTDGSGSAFKQLAMSAVWVNRMNPFVGENVQDSA